jgi:glutathione S-transferase
MLAHLSLAYETVELSIFEGEGKHPDILKLNPTGKVPILVLDDGRSLAESNAILSYLADGTPYLPSEPFARAKVQQWLCFEQEQVESVIGSLRHWVMTDKLKRRTEDVVSGKRQAALRTLTMLDGQLSARAFIAGDQYTIADIALYAYAGCAEEADLEVAPFTHFLRWRERVQAQPGFLQTRYAYSRDPHSGNEL